MTSDASPAITRHLLHRASATEPTPRFPGKARVSWSRFLAVTLPAMALAYAVTSTGTDAYVSSQPDTFTSKATIAVNTQNPLAGAEPLEQNARTYAKAASTDAKLREIASTAAIPPTPLPEFADKVRVEPIDGTSLLQVRATWSDAATAQRITEATVAMVTGAEESLDEGANNVSTAVLEGPSTPTVPDSKGAALIANAAGISAATLLGLVALALVLHHRRRRQHVIEEFADNDLLGIRTIPRHRATDQLVDREGNGDSTPVEQAADRLILRATLEGASTVVVTSCLGDSEGGYLAAGVATRAYIRGLGAHVIDCSPDEDCALLLSDVPPEATGQGAMHLYDPKDASVTAIAGYVADNASALLVVYTHSLDHAVNLTRFLPDTQLLVTVDASQEASVPLAKDVLVQHERLGIREPSVFAYETRSARSALARLFGGELAD